ncbi:MAG TPA: HAD-IA family hydrolase [Candidatus Hydrogenedentes bacterium]|nr:HAD-IA family hydrolase [Candidatus Hydrogenedentota bacterium]HOL76437.1 HAD-IA family hydrolase [Candidatus Hydrogenedentota bacterium]HPO85475.1 HAD-IA family hydrolase [Candidatus Hydrogenedentota bacterium]
MVRLFIFDFDGLIIDTETPDLISWQEIFQEYGQELPLAIWADCIGARADAFDPHAYLERLLGHALDRETIRQRRRARFYALVDEQPLRPGILEYIHEAKRRGILLSVASSADRKWVGGHLTKRGLIEHFACIKTAEDVSQAKPAPDLFLAVLRELSIPADEAIVFEDSPNGLRAAKAAGIFSVAVPNPTTVSLSLHDADLYTPSLADLPVEKLLEQFAQRKAHRKTTTAPFSESCT